MTEELSESALARFWAKVDQRGPDDCWDWTASKNKRGYGKMIVNGRLMLAHRLALVISGAHPTDGQLALHSCDKPSCVNPNHLRWGTQVENTADAIARNPGFAGGKGERDSNALLTEADVIAIRTSRGITRPQQAKLYGVSLGTIRDVVGGRTWRHTSAAGDAR